MIIAWKLPLTVAEAGALIRTARAKLPGMGPVIGSVASSMGGMLGASGEEAGAAVDLLLSLVDGRIPPLMWDDMPAEVVACATGYADDMIGTVPDAPHE